jgi:hypothetical protein
MTTQNQIIAFSILAFISVPLFTFVTIKTINKLTRPQVNSLTRTTGDIELDYIDPHPPDQIYQPLDMPNPNYINWSDRVPSFYTGRYPPSYFSGGNPPSFHSNDRSLINCCLEDNINLDYIFYIILFCVFLILIRKLIISKQLITAKLIVLLLLSIIYLQFGLLSLANIIIWIIVFFLFNFLLGIFRNPNNTQFKVIRAMAIIVIIFIILKNSLYNISILIPFSLFEIDFRDSFEWKFDSYGLKPKISYLKLQTLTKNVINLLDSLKDDENYSMSLSYISSYKEWQDNKDKVHPLFIDNPIIINKESDPIIISQFIMEKLNEKAYFVTNWLFKDSSINSMDPVILAVTVAIKVKF